jgi:hypothetical protein
LIDKPIGKQKKRLVLGVCGTTVGFVKEGQEYKMYKLDKTLYRLFLLLF